MRRQLASQGVKVPALAAEAMHAQQDARIALVAPLPIGHAVHVRISLLAPGLVTNFRAGWAWLQLQAWFVVDNGASHIVIVLADRRP